jgi:glycosyltransferase involved in cell wall biosynthesis
VYRRAREFQVLHFHIDYLHFPLSTRQKVPHVTTLHGRLDLPDLIPLYEEFPQVPVVSISNSQREPLKHVNWAATVYHGLPEDLYTLHEKPGDYLAFIGRISPEKRADRAIRIAKQAGRKLKMAAKVDAKDQEYFDTEIKPLLEGTDVEFIGEIGEGEKNDFLGNAAALLFPIDWPEPFGLVMIESMACGTPVIAYPEGSVPEVIDDGQTGFLVESIDQAVEAVRKIDRIDRGCCRRVFEKRFSARRMACDYLKVYQRLASTGAFQAGVS